MKFAGFIMTFNRPRILADTLRVIFEQSYPPEQMLVVDNGNAEETARILAGFDHGPVRHLPMAENLGPAGAAAIGLGRLLEDGAEYIYWIDDDNPPLTRDSLERVVTGLEGVGDGSVAGASAVGQRFDWKTGRVDRLEDRELTGLVEVDVVGGGQQLVLRADVARKVGLPNRDLFFGYEEFEYCLRIRNAGLRIVVPGGLMRDYRELSGRLNYTGPRGPALREDLGSLWRRYYGTRNYIYMMNSIFGRSDLALREAARALGRSIYSWRNGFAYGSRLTALHLRAIRDGYSGRLGRTLDPTPKTVA